jgi:hypothetical protein
VRDPLIALLIAVAVAGPDRGAGQAQPRVIILNPEQGAVVTTSSVAVVLKAEGVVIAPASEHRPGTAHYHLFLDQNVTPLDSAIPSRSGIVHLNSGRSWFTFEPVALGPHRLIAVLADPDHIPLHPLVSDTVRFTVKRRR